MGAAIALSEGLNEVVLNFAGVLTMRCSGWAPLAQAGAWCDARAGGLIVVIGVLAFMARCPERGP